MPVRRRDLARSGIHHLDQRSLAGCGVHGLAEQLGGQVQVHPARAAGNGGADGAGDTYTDVFSIEHAKGRLAQGFGNGQLVHLLVVTLLQIDDLALAGAADQDHREAIGGGVGQRGQAVEEARGGHRQADAGLARHETGDGGGITSVLLVAERNHAHAFSLHHASQVGDWNARQAVDIGNPVELQGVDDEMETICLFC